MSTKIQVRRDTAAAWTAANPVLASGEPGLETDTRREKIGDGVTAWAALAYRASGTSGGTTDAGALTGILSPARIADASLPLTKLAVDVATQAELNAVSSVANAAAAATGATPTPPRVATLSGPLTLADANNVVHMRNQAAATMTIPLTNTANYAAGTMIGVDRFATEVEIAPYAANTTMQRIITANGLTLRAVGSTATVEIVRRADPGPRPTGFWAVVSGDQFANTANGTVITSITPNAASTVALPAITPTGAQQPTVHRNAANGKTGIAFNGSSNTLPLSGAWLSLMNNRSNAMILVTALVAAGGVTGNRTLVSFSTGANTLSRAILKWRDTGSAAHQAGGRRTDADAGVFVSSATPTASPDLSVVAGRYVWSTSDLYVLRNNVVVGTQTTFQTDGVTPTTPSVVAAIGSNASGSDEWFWGTILDVCIGPDDATLRAAYQTWAELYYGEEALVTGDTVV